MKVYLTSLFEFDVEEAFGDEEMNLKGERATLKTLLQELTRKSEGAIEFIDPQNGKLNDEYFFTINGNEFQDMPKGLETELSDEDEVGIGYVNIFNLMGGG